MRGSDKQTGSLFSYVDLEERVPVGHPLRKIKSVVDAALVSLGSDSTGCMRAKVARRSRPSGSCARAWCRSCSRSAPNGS